jgi:O-antigen ligase
MKNLGIFPVFFLFAMCSFSLNHHFLPGPSIGELGLIIAFFFLLPLWPRLTKNSMPFVFGMGLLLLILLALSSLLHLRDNSVLRYKTLIFWTLHGTIFGFCYYWLTRKAEQNYSRLLRALYVLGLLSSILAIVQYLLGPKICSSAMPWGPSWTQWYTRFGFRVYSFFDNPLILGSVLCMLWPVFLQRLLTSRKQRMRNITELVIIGSAILATGSRSCFLVVFSITFLQCLPHINKEHLAGSLAGAFFFICFGLVLLAFSPVGKRMNTIFSLNGDGNLNQRITSWNAGIQMLSNNPLSGVGPGYFSDAYRYEYKPVQSQDDPSSFTMDNLIFQMGCEFGLPVAFVAGSIYFYLLVFSFVLLKRNPPFGGLFYSLVSFGVLSLGIALYATPVLWLLMVLFAMVSVQILNQRLYVPLKYINGPVWEK